MNRIVQSTKLTVHVRYANQFRSPHIQNTENLNESTMLLFFNASDRRLLFSYILSFVASVLEWILFSLSYFPSPHVPLVVMLDAQTYVENRASDCSP